MNKITENTVEQATLNYFSTLLPKLLSGEIRIKDTEKFIGRPA